jgi:hypothetical protein
LWVEQDAANSIKAINKIPAQYLIVFLIGVFMIYLQDVGIENQSVSSEHELKHAISSSRTK